MFLPEKDISILNTTLTVLRMPCAGRNELSPHSDTCLNYSASNELLLTQMTQNTLIPQPTSGDIVTPPAHNMHTTYTDAP